MIIAVNTRLLLAGKLEGIGYFSYEVLKRITTAHPEHTFYFFFDRPFDPAFIFSENVIPLVLQPPARHPLLWYLWFEISVYRTLKKIKAEVFFSPEGYLSLRSKVPTLMVLHDLAYLHHPENMQNAHLNYFRKYVPRFINRAEKIVTVSQFVKQDILSKFPAVSPEKISVCYNAARAGFLPMNATEKQNLQNEYTQGAPYFIYVGAIHPRKNIHRLIAAFDDFKNKSGTQHKLLLVGRMAWKTDDVTVAYNTAHFKKDIIFTGYVPENDLRALVGAAFCMVYVSIFEGFGMPIIEAMQCGVPVITSDTTALPEIAGDAALCVDPYDTEKISGAMGLLVKNENVRLSLIERGKRRASDFSWEKTADIIYETFLSLKV